MSVVPLTLAVSLSLVFTFVVFFLCAHARGRVSSPERDSLLPLAEEGLRPAKAARVEDGRRHAHADAGDCGCRDGSRPLCADSLRRG